MSQVCITANWIKQETEIGKDWIGYTSPYLRAIQTASIFGFVNDIDFMVDPGPREYHIVKNKPELVEGGMRVKNRSYMFRNMMWNAKDWDDEYCFYKNETFEEFVDRCQSFLYKLEKTEYNKFVVVSHGATCLVLKELASGTLPEMIVGLYQNNDKLWEDSTNISNSSLTWVSNKEVKWKSKVVYNEKQVFDMD